MQGGSSSNTSQYDVYVYICVGGIFLLSAMLTTWLDSMVAHGLDPDGCMSSALPIWSAGHVLVRFWKWPRGGAGLGGALGQVSYGGVQLRGPNPYPILGKAGLRKHTLF